MTSHTSNERLVVQLLVALVVIAACLYILRRKRRSLLEQDGPILSSEGMLGSADLQSMTKGSLSGFDYNLLTNDSGRVMYFIELGHNNWSHIIAYGDKSDIGGAVTRAFTKRWLVSVDLEGDFPEYFHLLCNPEAQATVREVFTPDIMVQFIDFCRAYDFEIFQNTLYLSRARQAVDISDQTSLTTDLTNFLKQNAQVLSRL